MGKDYKYDIDMGPETVVPETVVVKFYSCCSYPVNTKVRTCGCWVTLHC